MVIEMESFMTGASNILLDTASTATSAASSFFGLDTAIITSVVTLVGIILGVGYTWRKEKTSNLAGYRSYEKDVQEQMLKQINQLRAGSEKYAMVRMKLLGMNGIDGEALIKEIEKEYKEINE